MIKLGVRSAGLALAAALVAVPLVATPVAAGAAVVHRHGDKTEKVVALTFDDGYSASRTQRIAAILDEYGVTATFLPYADAVSGAPAVWRSVAERFPIANHTISHANLKKLTASQVYREIDGARRIIEDVTGRAMLRVFRPPYGNYNATVLEQSYKAGFEKVAMWNVDSGDGLGLGDEEVYRRAIAGGNGAIVLLHAGPAPTVRVLPRIIERYRARGFRFVHLGEMLDVPWNSSDTVPSEPPRTGAQPTAPTPDPTARPGDPVTNPGVPVEEPPATPPVRNHRWTDWPADHRRSEVLRPL